MTKEFEDKGNNYSIRENVNIGEYDNINCINCVD